MDIFVKYHIFKRAKEEGREIPENYQQMLKSLNDMPQLSGNKIVFWLLKDNFRKHLSATAIAKGRIVCSLEWAAIYVLYHCPQTENAFRITVGHELTHKDGDFRKCGYCGNNRKLINWANEIHADFGGAQKMLNSNRECLAKSCEYKRQYRLKYSGQDGDSKSHPSYQRRKCYAENYNFNYELIQRVAKDVGCTNRKLIQNISNYFADILLY